MIDLTDVNNAWAVLGVIVALGAITVAILHIVNEFSPIRWIFHGYMIGDWIRERVVEYRQTRDAKPAQQKSDEKTTESKSDEKTAPLNLKALPDTDPNPEVRTSTMSQGDHEKKAFDLLVTTATSGYGVAFLGLPTNQLIGQINAAAQIVVDDPIQYYPLLCVLSQPAAPKVRIFYGERPEQPPATRHLKDLTTICEFAIENEDGKKEPTPAYLQARARIGHAIQRNLDGLQINLTNRGFQIALGLALAIGIVLAGLVVRGQGFIGTLLVGAAAGYIALVIGDVFAILRRLGQR